MQDTLVKALRFSDRFERGTNLRAWLSTILHNTWRNRLRDTGREAPRRRRQLAPRRSRAGGRRPRRTGDSGAVAAPRETLDADLRAALDELPEVFRQAVWLRDVEEFSYAEIAKMLDVPIGTVMSRISRGRRMLLGAELQKATQSKRCRMSDCRRIIDSLTHFTDDLLQPAGASRDRAAPGRVPPVPSRLADERRGRHVLRHAASRLVSRAVASGTCVHDASRSFTSRRAPVAIDLRPWLAPHARPVLLAA